jgi:CubicO group peptidase (beta-lactamase class C family)
MKKSISKLMVLVIALIFAQNIYAQEIFDEKSKDKRIDEYVKSIMDEFQIPGLALAVVKDNKIFKVKAYGVKNLDTKVPLTAESIFHMASVSKPFSATAIMQLVEEGKINLNDPLIKYLPYFKLDDPRYQEITIKQMLTHTSGIPDENDYEWDKPQYDAMAAERYVRSLANEKMIAAPGEKYKYSNMAFDILADVIAKVSGMTFEDYIKEKILDPLNMKDSDFLRERIRPELRTSGHIFNLKPRVSEVYPYNRRHAPSSCLNASVQEMCNWAIANMKKGAFKGKRILEESSYKYLFAPQVEITQNRSIGLSWYIDQHRKNKTISHGGRDVGYTSYIVMLPEKSLAVIAAVNFDGEPIIIDLTFGVIDIMLGFEPSQPKIPIYIIVSKAILDSGIEKAIEQYRELKKYKPNRYKFRENQLNWLGYHLIDNNRLKDAIEIFKLNVEMFPQSYNAYDSLGEAYMKAGNRELAVANYEKSLDLNSENNNAKEQIKKLRQKK